MGKHNTKTLEEKIKIVKEFKKGATIRYLMSKYKISNAGTVSRWNKEYEEGRLGIDNRGRKLKEVDEAEILKKAYALLMEIRTQQHK